jgi:hypothetical protein
MGRPLAPSSLSRPAAPGRPGQPMNGRANGSVSSRLASQAPAGRPGRADARMHEATLRPRSHGDASAPRGIDRPGTPTSELKRRRANVLFVLVLTTVCAGFLAATTDSKAMVYIFALSMLALGGYVYLLVTVNQREMYARGYEADFDAPRQPARRVRRAERWDFDDLDEYGGYDVPVRRQAPARQMVRSTPPSRQAPARQTQVRQAPPRQESAPAPVRKRPVVQPPAAREPQVAADYPGSGTSGRISYGRQRGPVTRQAALEPRDPYGRDGHGWETVGRDPTRPAPLRNGRHATGQQQAVARRHYSQTG